MIHIPFSPKFRYMVVCRGVRFFVDAIRVVIVGGPGPGAAHRVTVTAPGIGPWWAQHSVLRWFPIAIGSDGVVVFQQAHDWLYLTDCVRTKSHLEDRLVFVSRGGSWTVTTSKLPPWEQAKRGLPLGSVQGAAGSRR